MKGLVIAGIVAILTCCVLDTAAGGGVDLPSYPSHRKLNLRERTVTASSTCVKRETFQRKSCNNKYVPKKATDTSRNSAWVSQRLDSARENITFTVDLDQQYYLREIRVHSGPTSHSMAWEVQVSADGEVYRTLVYFVPSPSNCPPDTHYIRDLAGSPGSVADGVPLCSDQPRHLLDARGLTDKTVYRIPLMIPYMGGARNSLNPALMAFLKSRYVRLFFKFVEPPEIKVSPTRYISISDLGVWASCGCNGFAAQCLEDPVTARYTCQCEGHTCGTDCSSCCPGYGGAEFMSFDSGNGTTCRKCECNGHATSCQFDPEAGTSVCNNCTNATAGPHCEVCGDGYYRSSVDKPCQECNCFEENSNGRTCDDKGQCDCLPGYEGLKCSTCEEGKVFNSFTRTCQECACDPRGTTKCENGTCVCAEEFTGGLCNRCQDGYYGYPNCRDCGCPSDPLVLVLGVCDPVSGQCPCPANRNGRRCESCDFGYYGNNVAQPCQPCNCNENGSLLTTCNRVTGKCICKVGYKGLKCDGNSDEFFGFPSAIQCDCDIRGSEDNICDKKTGHCTCREGAIGRRCDQCEDGTYPSLQGGCASCKCSPIGAVSLNCTINGRCSCKEGVGGQNCETCLPGYWNFGQNGCQSCSCNRTGTDPRQICDALSGDCICVAEHAGETCGECNTTRLHIATEDGCEICGNCVEPLVNRTDTVITLLNKTIELLPNLTIRIGRFDLVYVERNISIFSAFLELWSRDVQSKEAALGLVEDPPSVPGTFILDIRPPLLTQHSELRKIVNTSTEFVGLDEFGRMVAETTGATFTFSSKLNSKYSSLRMTVQELAMYLEELQKMLQENFERVRDKEIEANRVNDIVKNRNFDRTAKEVTEQLEKATSHFSESEHLETEAQSFFNLANREVNEFISSAVEGRLETALEWLSNTSDTVTSTEFENAAIPPLQDKINEHLPVVEDLYQKDKQNLSVLTEAVVDNEAQLAGSLHTFSEAQMNYRKALELFGSLNRSTNSFEEGLYDVIPDPNGELRAEIHAQEIFDNGSEIHSSSKDLLNETKVFLKALPPIPDVSFISLEHTLQVAIQQSSSADSQLKFANLTNLLGEVVDANVTSYRLLKEALEYEDNSTDVKSLVDDVEMRYVLAENWTSTLEDRLSAVSAGLDELERKPDFAGNFDGIRRSLETSNATTLAVNSTLETITAAVPSIQNDITVSRDNTLVIHKNINASRFLLDNLPSQVDQTNVTMMAVDGAIDALMETNEDIIDEIDDIIIGLNSIHNMLQKVNAPAIFESSDRDPRPYLSMQPPDKSEIGIPVLFEVIDLYLVPNGLSRQGALLFYAGPAWKKDDLNYTREMKEETFIALTASRGQLTLHYKLKMCEGGEECQLSGERMLDHPGGRLLDVVPNHVQIMRIGNQLRLVRRRGGDNGDSKMSTTNEQEGQLLFIHSPRTVYYIGGQPGDVKIYDSVDGYESYSGNVNLLMYNRKEWSIWNIRDSSLTQFWLYTNNRKKGNTLVTKDISESELLSFDGSGYLYTERLGGGVNRRIRTTDRGNSELVFSISARSLDGLIVFMYEPSEGMSLEVSLTNGVVMLQIVDYFQKSNGTLYFHLTGQDFQLKVQQYKFQSGYLVNINLPDLPATVFMIKNYFRVTTDTQVWFGGYVKDIADNLRKKNKEEVAYVPKVKTSFKGSISVALKEPLDSNSQNIFVTSIDIFRDYYINSDHQQGVSRTFIKQPFVDEVGFTGQSYLTFKDVRLQGLIDIQEYRPSSYVDSYALLFRTDRPQGGVLFHAESKTSGLLLFFEDGVVKVNLTHSGEVLTMSSSTPVVEVNQWHSVFVHVTFTSNDRSFKLFVDNKLEQGVDGLEGWRVHQSEVNFMISRLTLGGSPSVQTANFRGCIRDFVVQENPFDAFTNVISTQQPAKSNETLPGLSVIADVTFYECPVLEEHRPEEPYPVLLPVVEDNCVPAEDVKVVPFSLGGFRRSTSLMTSNTIPLLERNFVITFNITFYDDRQIAGITSGHDQTTSSDGYRHIFSLTSKYDEIVSIVLNANHNMVMAVKRRNDVQETVLKSSVTENLNVELNCSGSDDVFTCSFNGMAAVMVARREYFHPNWPMVFGKATAMENAMEEPLDSFIGCLGDFSISGVPYSNLHTGQPCFDDATPGYHFNGTAYIAVSNVSREVSFTFKAIRKDGLLVAILEKMDDDSFKVKVAIGYRAGALSAVSSGTEGVMLLEEESSSGCGLLSNLTVTPDEKMVGIVFCEGTMCHSMVTLKVSVSSSDQLYIGGIPSDVEIEDFDLFLFLKPIGVSPMRLPPFFVGTLYPPLPTDPDLKLSNVNLGPAP